MPHFDSGTLEVILYIGAAAVIAFLGYRAGRLIGALAAHKSIARKDARKNNVRAGGKNVF